MQAVKTLNSSKDLARYYTHVDQKPLGKGAYGEVRRAIRKSDNQEVVLKYMQPEVGFNFAALLKDVHREWLVMYNLNHPNLPKYYQLYELPAENKVVIEMSLARGENLHDFIEGTDTLTPAQAWEVVYQLFSTLTFLHRLSLVHRDIKADNIILDRSHSYPRITVVDMGFACFYSTRDTFKKCDRNKAGTVGFMSPELLHQSMDRDYGFDPLPASDVWAAGVTTYFLFESMLPFTNQGDPDILEKEVADLTVAYDDPAYKEVVARTLVVDWKARATADEILRIASDRTKALGVPRMEPVKRSRDDRAPSVKRARTEPGILDWIINMFK